MFQKNDVKRRTLLEILDPAQFCQVKIPIIQRDYVQGCDKKVGGDLVDYILENLDSGTQIELDFVYGDCSRAKVFVPLDGQQRLTTLWLLHWYLGLKTGKIGTILDRLKNFIYETRPSSQEFLDRLCDDKAGLQLKPDKSFAEQIVDNAFWYNQAWALDPSINNFIAMLDTIRERAAKLDALKLFQNLEAGIIGFYHLAEDNFGLSDEVYIRMNARGKKLSDFETFKSRLFQVADKEKDLCKELSDKIDSLWVDHLWPYRADKIYVVDDNIMRYIVFIAKMRFVSSLPTTIDKVRWDSADEEEVLKTFEDKSNLEFLIKAFDALPCLARLAKDIDFEWNNKPGLKTELEIVVKTPIRENEGRIADLYVYSALLFIDKYPCSEVSSICGENIDYFLRIIRNLLGNTEDTSIREWPRIIDSIKKFVTNAEISATLQTYLLTNMKIIGFAPEALATERFKIKLLQAEDSFNCLLQKIDENYFLRGRIKGLAEEILKPANWEDIQKAPESLCPVQLQGLFEGYVELAAYNGQGRDHYQGAWGDLLHTEMYKIDGKWCHCPTKLQIWTEHPALMAFAKEVHDHGNNAEKASLVREKEFINSLIKELGSPCDTDDPQKQLYLLYIYTKRILKKSWQEFFRQNKFNFGWQDIDSDFCTPFIHTAGSSCQQIFQCVPLYFVPTDEPRKWRTPIVQIGSDCNIICQKLIDFANNDDMNE